MKRRSRPRRSEFPAAVAFLTPNLLGVLVFTVFPVVFSVVLAMSNWDLRRHNMFHEEPLRFVGLSNFVSLVTESDFLRFLGNTLFLMMGIPFAVAGSLTAALLLSKDTRGGGGRTHRALIVAAMLTVTCAALAALGMGATAMTMVLGGTACAILLGGVLGGTTVYRTVFYAPCFTAGVATFVLWKKLYNPLYGPINTALRPVLDTLAAAVNTLPPGAVRAVGWLAFALMAALLWHGLSRLRRDWRDGEVGSAALVLPVGVLFVPMVLAMVWRYTRELVPMLLIAAIVVIFIQVTMTVRRPRTFTCAATTGGGSALLMAVALMVGELVLLGLAAACAHLPAMAVDGLEPPQWLTDPAWAKPSMMVIAFWSAIGSNNMLLYLAALSNVPPELYEAADIDGAKRGQRFWSVTWPQLAPTTFFIAVMSTIYGLQGGFEMARTLTKGGPDGATTTLSYDIYVTAFETGRLGYAAAIAWTLFLIVLTLTMVNWRFGREHE